MSSVGWTLEVGAAKRFHSPARIFAMSEKYVPQVPLMFTAYQRYQEFCGRVSVTPMDLESWAKVSASKWSIRGDGIDGYEKRTKRPVAGE